MKLSMDKEQFLSIAKRKIQPDYIEWALNNWDYLTRVNTPLVNVNSSSKIVKGEKLGFYTAILYLKPADMVAIKTLCPFAGKAGCKDGCLESSGQLGMMTADNAKIKRTILFLVDREAFEIELSKELTKHYLKHGDNFACRLNGTSDIDWFKFILDHPSITFYDYSKVLAYVKRAQKLGNYHITFSGSANSIETINQTALAIRSGFNTVIACDTKELKGEWQRPAKLGNSSLVDMDQTDLRFKDKAGSIGTLKIKGGNKQERASRIGTNNFFFNEKSLAQLSIAL